eukprot:3302606-Rhodomonas_salina.1
MVVGRDHVRRSEGFDPQSVVRVIGLPLSTCPDTLCPALLFQLDRSDIAYRPAIGWGCEVHPLPRDHSPPCVVEAAKSCQDAGLPGLVERIQEDDGAVEGGQETCVELCAAELDVRVSSF